eukprot:10116072-Alexandrium_andersonii.AAC.1
MPIEDPAHRKEQDSAHPDHGGRVPLREGSTGSKLLRSHLPTHFGDTPNTRPHAEEPTRDLARHTNTFPQRADYARRDSVEGAGVVPALRI